MKVLHVISELFPLVKTGGLGDFGYSLPHALKDLGVDVRLLLPAYGDVLRTLKKPRVVATLDIPVAGTARTFRVLEVLPKGFRVPVWLADCPSLFDRPGNPYIDEHGADWPDNAERYACFAQLAARIATGALPDGWRADVVHCHDWQTGLVPAFLHEQGQPPRSIFTIHNLAFGGHFSRAEFLRLQLPESLWHLEGVEFYGGFSMLKAGLVYADAITTVSRTYASEILTPAFGYGMDGILRHYSDKLRGILNGLDHAIWNTATDPLLAMNYGIDDREAGRAANRVALFNEIDWQPAAALADQPLFGSVGRLTEQKGSDLLAEAAGRLLAQLKASFVIIGDGQKDYIDRLQQLQARFPDRVRLFIGYSERIAHLVEAAADFFVMPSRYEPCGLNQLYSLCYGTPPVVHHTGGLADTVVDATEENLLNGTATGVVFYRPDSESLHAALLRAVALFHHPKYWPGVQKTAMHQDFSWRESAQQYIALYQEPGI
ncbi:MAG TPA: glycogen synthase GlgA [Gammaproteobacteria bacterium]|nr:glycogen synthase GlgA [Gammaproteobacteria bacterium]